MSQASTDISSENSTMVTIQLTDTAEQNEYQVSLEALKKSETIQNMIEDIGDFDPSQPLMIPNITDPIIWEKIQEFLEYMCTGSFPTDRQDHRVKEYTDWEKAYLEKLDHPLLFEIIQATDFLCCQPLLHVTCRQVAERIKGKAPDQIRTMFGLKNDLTPAQEQKVQGETEWMKKEETDQ